MFGLGMPEILMILAIALIVIGPKKLPDLAKTLGRAMGEFKRSAQDFKRSIDVETTVKDFKDGLDIPKTDLNKILTDPPENDETADAVQEQPADGNQEKADDEDKEKGSVTDKEERNLQEPDKKMPDNEKKIPKEDKDFDKTRNASENDKIDNI